MQLVFSTMLKLWQIITIGLVATLLSILIQNFWTINCLSNKQFSSKRKPSRLSKSRFIFLCFHSPHSKSRLSFFSSLQHCVVPPVVLSRTCPTRVHVGTGPSPSPRRAIEFLRAKSPRPTFTMCANSAQTWFFINFHTSSSSSSGVVWVWVCGCANTRTFFFTLSQNPGTPFWFLGGTTPLYSPFPSRGRVGTYTSRLKDSRPGAII